MNFRSLEHSLMPALAGALALGGLAATAPAAQAAEGQDVYIAEVTAFQRADVNMVYAVSAEFTDISGVGPAPDGTVVRLDAYSCGNFLQTATDTLASGKNIVVVNLSPDGELDGTENSVNKRVGPSLDLVATITQPGNPSYERSVNYDGYQVSRPSCLQINHPLRPKWSKKNQARAVVGRRLSVTPTTAPGAKVTYAWKLRNRYGRVTGRTFGTGRGIRLKRAWVGRRLGVVVKVRKTGYQPQTKTLVFPRVRGR